MYDPPFVAHLTILLLYCWDFPPLGVVVVVVCEGGGGRDDCGKDWSDFCIWPGNEDQESINFFPRSENFGRAVVAWTDLQSNWTNH